MAAVEHLDNDVTRALAEALKAARAGEITSVAIVGVRDGEPWRDYNLDPDDAYVFYVALAGLGSELEPWLLDQEE